MERVLIEQNPWWEDKSAINRDKDILEYENAKVKFTIPKLEPEGGLYIIRGPRQVGKTTLLKFMIKKRLKSANPESVFYFDAECGVPIEQAIRSYLDFSNEERKMMCIDEITSDKKWAAKIKYFIDTGKITKKDTVIVSGSSSIDLKEGGERLPGRLVEGREYLFYPYSFRDYIKRPLPPSTLLNFDVKEAKKVHMSEEIRSSFFRYIENGGLPAVWNTERELARERYARWIEGMTSRAKKSMVYSKELLKKLSEKTFFDFLGLSREKA